MYFYIIFAFLSRILEHKKGDSIFLNNYTCVLLEYKANLHWKQNQNNKSMYLFQEEDHSYDSDFFNDNIIDKIAALLF